MKLRKAVLMALTAVFGAVQAWGASWSQLTLTHVSSGGSYFSGEDASKLFDNSAGTKWCATFGSDGQNWVEFTAWGGVPTRLDLVSANDTAENPNRSWTGWTLYGLDGSEWVLIKKWSNQSLNLTYGAATTFCFENDCMYERYKVVLNARAGTSDVCHQMADLKLYTDTSRSPSTVECSSWATVKLNLEVGNSVRLTQNVSQDSQCEIPSNKGTMTLDLNGYTINRTASYRAFVVNSGNTFTVRNGTFDGQDYAFQSDGHFLYNQGATTTLDGVTIKRCKNTSSGYWGTLYIPSGTLTMKGGSLQSCTTVGNGGGAYVSGGTFVMTDGATIDSCSSTFTGDSALGGGGVYVGSGTFRLENGTIRNCTASRNGGGVYVNSGTFTMNGGTISGCLATTAGSGYGGGVCIGSGSFTMNGGSITQCRAVWGGAFHVPGSGSATISGGTLSGNTATWSDNGGNVFGQDGGTVTICGGVYTGNGSAPLHLMNWDLNTGTFTLAGGVFDFQPSMKSKCISSWNGGAETQIGSMWVVGDSILTNSNGQLTAGTYTFNPTKAEYVAAGLSVVEGKYVVQDASTSPVTYVIQDDEYVRATTWAQVKANLEAGNRVKLTQDIVQSNGTSFVSKTGGKSALLDLNGHTITQGYDGSTAVWIVQDYQGVVDLTIMDSVGTGAIIGNPDMATTAGDGGGAFQVKKSGSSLTLKSGTLKNFRLTASGMNGGCIYVGSGASFTMNGGMITNCTCSSQGGAVYNAGKTTMNGGVLLGNMAGGSATTVNGGVADVSLIGDKKASDKSCTQIGSLWVVGNAIVCDANERLTAGTYTFNPTNAEYVAAGVVDPAKAVVTGSGASYALRIAGTPDCNTWEMYKANLEAGNGVKLVQDVTNAAPVTVDGGWTVAVDLNGHNLVAGDEGRFFVVSDGGLTIEGGGTIDGNGFTCPTAGQMAYVDSTNATLTISDVTVQNMKSADCGGAICVSNGVLTVSNATFRACSAESYGGGICNFNGTLTLDDCAIEDCTSAKGGGAVFNANEE